MPPSDLDITGTAHLWIQQHGDDATTRAREMAEKMRCRGDADGADVWLRIIVAIGTLGIPRQKPVTERARIHQLTSILKHAFREVLGECDGFLACCSQVALARLAIDLMRR